MKVNFLGAIPSKAQLQPKVLRHPTRDQAKSQKGFDELSHLNYQAEAL